MKLLTIENAKTSKGEKMGYMTGIVYMLPDERTCPLATSANCFNSCLVNAGLASVYPRINEVRKERRELFYNDRKEFFKQLDKEIKSFIKKAKKEKMIPVVRLNGTSDIMYESIQYLGYANIFEAYPDIQFYDYTKIAVRLTKPLPQNYDLTFSFSNSNAYKKSVEKALKRTTRIAVVFKNGLPTRFMGRLVVDGDDTDLRFLDRQGIIIGLKAKGIAKTDKSDFIVDTLTVEA